MSETTVNLDEAPAAPTADADTVAAGRGRPRTGETIERDEKVFAFVAAADAGVNRKQIVAALELEGNAVYLSLYRLRVAGRVVRNGAIWTAAKVEAPAAEAPTV